VAEGLIEKDTVSDAVDDAEGGPGEADAADDAEGAPGEAEPEGESDAGRESVN
jgi:hypothetical protein